MLSWNTFKISNQLERNLLKGPKLHNSKVWKIKLGQSFEDELILNFTQSYMSKNIFNHLFFHMSIYTTKKMFH